MTERHEPVLLDEAIRLLAVRPGDTVVDGTVGGAGHFSALMSRLGQGGTLIGFDADPAAIARGQEAAKRAPKGVRTLLVNRNFRDLDSVLDEQGIETVDRILLDLGWSSYHLDSQRGFSFKGSEPLLMTYGTDAEATTAAEIVNTSPEETLADIFFTYGEERFARGIARSIVRIRKASPILTTDQLVEAVMEGTPSWYHHRRLHPATKVFQALRIAVNDELGALRDVLETAMRRLACGGRIAVITFHSIEDRVVKNALRDAAHAGQGQLTTKKPVVPGTMESMRNPRARSAKLRVYEQCRDDMSPLITFSTFAYA